MLIAIFLSVMAFLVISLTPMLFARVPFSRPFVKGSLWRRSIAQSFRALNQVVKLSPIEPYSSAFWAVIYFHPLPFGQKQINITYRAFHVFSSF
jgi:hypothetical protein